MKIYLVGGAVRDELLNIPIEEKDFVVIGAHIEDMLKKGFKPVGKEFPVFLHPKTKEEYALARTEKKIAKGYKGFTFYTSPDVTLEEDLKRRDITINAIAKDDHGNLIDPFNGKKDLEKKILRHVSMAFSEDPVRILRVARFASRLKNFTVADETNELMKSMVESGEVDALVPERIWKELGRALMENYPWRFFEVLNDCGALKVIFPEIDALFGIPGPANWHPEIDTGIHTILCLKQAVKLGADLSTRFAVLCHDFGKALSKKEFLPKHHGHEERGVSIIKKFCSRLRVPKECEQLAVLVCRFHSIVHKAFELTPKTLLKLFKSMDAFRRHERFEKILMACEADAKGRKGFENSDYPQSVYLKKLSAVCRQIDIKSLIKDLSNARDIEKKIHGARLLEIKKLVRSKS